MHLSEFVVRDFMNLERVMHPDGVVVVDDVLPNHPVQARRRRESRVWTGDVWRAVKLLKEVRPDLKLTWLDAAPSGLLVITGLKPENRVLWTHYNPLMRELINGNFASMMGADPGEVSENPPKDLIKRRNALEPSLETLEGIVPNPI